MIQQQIKHILGRKKVATISELCQATGRAEITVRKALTGLDYVTSYDQNSRFYALLSVCRFGRRGIWRHKKASFTCYGTLAGLLVALVDDSLSGHTSSELETITGVSMTGVLQRLVKKGELIRVRWKREYVYFSSRSKRCRESQARKRFGSSAPLARQEEDLTVDEMKKTIVILLEIIRNRPKSIRQLQETLHRTHPEISRGLVSDVRRQHGIRLKKKD